MNKLVKRMVGWCVLASTLDLLLVIPAVAAAAPAVHFAGFAYAGPYSGIHALFPYTSALDPPSGSSGTSPLDTRLRTMLSQQTFPGFTLDLTSLGDTSTGDALAMALVLDDESVSVEKIQDHVYKLLITLDAQALFFNAKQMQIVASYPFGLDYVDASATPPTHAYISSVIDKIYMGGASADLFSQFLKVLADVRLKARYGDTIQVAAVQISNRALQAMPQAMQHNLAGTQALLATRFADYLSKNANVPILPYTKGYAVGNKIAASFANGDVFNLAVPHPDYAITLRISGFKKILYAKAAGGSSWVYGAFASFKVAEPLSNHVYMDVQAKNGAVKLVPASQSTVADWPAYDDTLLGLMQQITQQFANPEQSWVKDHTGNPSNMKQFQDVAEVLKSCQ